VSGLGAIAERLSAKRWTQALADDYIGASRRYCVAHAASATVRDSAASGGAVSALLLSALASGDADACLVARTVIEDGRVRLRYELATSQADVLSARGSTYVLGDFVREAIPLIESAPGRVAVVCLPCEATALSKRPELADKLALVIALFCGHATRPELVDHLADRLVGQADSQLTDFRFRSGHWRGQLSASFADGTVVERPFSVYGRPQNLYYAAAKKCLYCGDHFGYDADVCAGDLWSARFKDDPIKHSALVVKSPRGLSALETAEKAGVLEAEDVGFETVLDGQRRGAPFHWNVSARSKAGRRLGIAIPDHGQPVAWHEHLAARIVLRNALATQTPEGLARVLARPAWYDKLLLYVLKGLESLS
jgi:coenzyme F420-reducing hydrogenase beta subunit